MLILMLFVMFVTGWVEEIAPLNNPAPWDKQILYISFLFLCLYLSFTYISLVVSVL